MAQSVQGKGRELVVLVHGLFGHRFQLLPIAVSLSRRFDVLNFGYRSRADTLHGHSQSLVDVVETRLKKEPQPVHFVSHSFGGLLVHRAFSQRLRDLLGDHMQHSRCVLVSPPLRGAAFARAFQRENIRGPEAMKDVIHGTAKVILGENCGAELLMHDEHWFAKQLGEIPPEVEVLVVAGHRGRLNPLIDEDSDGVVGLRESLLRRSHYRMEVELNHKLILYSPTVITSISDFLAGKQVGSLTRGLADEACAL
ncbi:Alpha/beta hydrolase [Gracilaria domingensis]|nr:Alpha/beta hydrolase [Gracilaria domingensis]